MLGYDALKTEVLARLGNRTDISSRLDRWINYAYMELLLQPRFSFYELDRSGTFNTVASTQSYDLVTNFTDLWFVLDLTDTTNHRKLKRSHWQVLDDIQPTTGRPERYARFSTTVLLDPTPDGVYVIQTRYRKRPADLASGSSFGLGTEWEEPIIALATLKGFEALKDKQAAAETRGMLEGMLLARQDVPMLEDMDSTTTLAPVMDERWVHG